MRTIFSLLFGLGLSLAQPAWSQDMVAATDAQVEQARAPIPEWMDSVSAPFVVVHGHPSQRPLLMALSQHASTSYLALADRLGVPLGSRVDVVVAPTPELFHSLQPSPAPAHADGVAWPGLGYVLLRSPSQRGGVQTGLDQVLDHELVHVLIGRAAGGRPLPTWLQEGLAEVLSGQSGPDNAQRLIARRGLGELPSLDSLSRGFPADPLRAELAYAASADFFSWLIAEKGDAVLPVLMKQLAAGAPVDFALRQATGEPMADLEARWRKGWEGWGLSAAQFAQIDGLALGFGGIALVGAGLMRRRRFHERLAEMEAEEALVDALVEEMRARRPSGAGYDGDGYVSPRLVAN